MRLKTKILKCLFGIMIFFFVFPMIAQAQQIIIDKPVRAGELTLFPSMEDENIYYYLPDQLRLATNKNGDPQFSFLRYVENVRSAPGEAEIREGTGGGIVHAVISLSVTPEQITEAKNQLRQINEEGIVKGPVIYNSGIMSIVSSFTNPEGDLTEQVVGIGKAPLIDGQKAAVSIELTKKGAKILWESFKTPTPDISFSFEMELQGYRSPKKAIIEADFEKIYNHHGFQLGAAGGTKNIMFGGEIDIAFDELRNSGAIKITNMGSDAEMDKLIETAYNKLTTMMFNPVGTGDNLTKELVKGITGKKSMLDRATDLYKQSNKKPVSKGKKTSSLFNFPVSNDGVLWACAEPVNAYTLSNLYYGLLGKQAEWEPKHITQTYKDCINGLPLPEEIKYDYNNDIDAGRYIKKSMLKNLFREHNKEKKPDIYFSKYLLTEDEQNRFSGILNGTQKLNDEIKQLIYDRVVRVVYAQDFLNEKQKTYILDEIEPDANQIWCHTLGLTYVAFLNREKIVHMPQTEQWARIVRKIYDLRTAAGENSTASNDTRDSQVEDKENKTIKDDSKPNTSSNHEEWPKHIKEILKDFINLLFLSEETKNDAIDKINAEERVPIDDLIEASNSGLEQHKMIITHEDGSEYSAGSLKPKSMAYYRQYLMNDIEKAKYSKIIDGLQPPDKDFNEFIRGMVTLIIFGQDFLNSEQKMYINGLSTPDASVAWDLSLTATYDAWINRNGIKSLPSDKKYASTIKEIARLAGQAKKSDDKKDNSISSSSGNSKSKSSNKTDKKATTASKKKGIAAKSSSSKKKDAKKKTEAKKKTDAKKKKKSDFKMAIMASYQFKKIKQKGKFKINLNKYTSDKITLRFDENIGNIDCDKCFHQVNLDDPLFKQREIVAMLDGFNFTDFGKYINFVSLKMKKTHQNGKITYDEVRIDRDNFAASANNFKLLYGWNGDDNRTKWLDYEYQAQWSFFGGNELISDWSIANGNAINLSAPYVRRTIELEADPELIKEKRVRSINVKIYYQLGDKEEVKMISMMPSREQYSSAVDIMLPEGVLEYDYEISWRLFGNKTVSSGRQKTSEMILFVDELEI